MTDDSQPKKRRASLLERAAAELTRESAATKSKRKLPPIDSHPKVLPPEPRADLRAPPAERVEASPAATPAAAPKTEQPVDKTGRRSRRGFIDLPTLRDMGYVVPDSPATATAEEFRIVKRQLLLNAMAQGDRKIENGNLILVNSSQPNEGKTFCATNLALSIASEPDLTVLLVDADFAKPEILSTLGLEGGKGLIDVIADPSIELSDCLIRTNIENLSVLPAGRQHNLTTELLASERMGRMIDEIGQRYSDRIIIFDSPPCLASSAASVLALHVGQTLFIVEAETTSETDVRDGLAIMSGCDEVHLLLNKARYAGFGRRFGTYYGYGA